jgi:WhiB family redox-sensing transcriptional regulator
VLRLPTRRSLMIHDILNWATNIPAWMDDADCANSFPETWFSLASEDVAQAKRVCAECPVRLKCLSFAVETNQAAGTWGGLTETERAEMRKNRGTDAA